MYMTGFGNRSKFEIKVQRKERSLRKSVVSYIGASSEFTGKNLAVALDVVADFVFQNQKLLSFYHRLP